MIEKKRDLHGFYVRISEDTGAAVGAHVEWLERVMDSETGEVYAANMLPPEPLEPSREALEPLMGEAAVAALAELDRERAAHAQTVTELDRERGILMQTLAELTALTALTEQHAALLAQIAVLESSADHAIDHPGS